MSENLFSFFAAAIPDPNRAFLLPPDPRDAISFHQAFACAGRFAHLLASRGVKRGDRVAVQVEKSPEAVFLYFACLRLGAIYVPFNPAYTADELAYLISDAEPALLVCVPEKEGVARSLFSQGPILTLGGNGETGSLIQEARDMPEDFSNAVMADNDLAAILYTSGTTGRSKGAMLSHGNLRSNAVALKDLWQFSDKDVLLHVLPIFHTHGLFVAINVALAASSSIIFLPKFDPDGIFHELPRATVMMGVPTLYVRLLSDPRLDRAVRHMRLFVCGSAPLPVEIFIQWQERTGFTLLERYGMTETNMNTSNPYSGARKPGTVGLPLPGTEIRIVDRHGDAVPQGEVGMITVRGPNVFQGYWRQPDKTKAELRADGFFVTGDLGCQDGDGYISIVGRGKDLVISGGLNVYPREVETSLNALPGVTDSAVFGLPHPDLGEGVTAAVVAEHGMTEARILAALENRLANFKRPKRILFVDEIPRNAMGKVQKPLLQKKYSGLYMEGK
ncbi:MAG TPA: malonyl-CoA synthase [Rhizomicrobium sp.]|nr:malonyl-CoA synthase [Rhizomicrobium sp.]